MTSAQLAAVALILRLPELLPAKLLILALAAVMEALFTERTVALAVCCAVVVTQDMMAVRASSSYFLHVPKAVLHLFSCLVMALALLLVLHCFSDWAVLFSMGPTQHPQASDTFVLVEPNVLFKHAVVAVVKLLTRLSHKVVSVVLGFGKFDGLLQYRSVIRLS